MTAGYPSETVYDTEDEQRAWPLRAILWLEQWARPYLGWGALLTAMGLTVLPAAAVRANRWVALGSLQTILDLAGPLAVAAVWLAWGWRRPVGERWHPAAAALRTLAVVAAGPLVMSQLLLGWVPGPVRLVQTAFAGSWGALPFQVVDEWSRFLTRLQLWWSGVAAGGAAQDNLVFAAIGSLVLWGIGLATGWLARRTRQGYAAAAPSLWLLGTIQLYSSSGRYLLVTGLALTLLLQLLLDHQLLLKRWEALGLDYSPGLLVDRFISVLSAAVLVLTLATVMPNLYVTPLVMRYYAWMAPFNERIEGFLESMFPDVRATSRLRGGGLGGGLPNEFLLQGGPENSGVEVMRVRTNEASAYTGPYEEQTAPPGHYMRGVTLSIYDGRGWHNPEDLVREDVQANSRWTADEPWGRKLIVQSINLATLTQVIYAAPEPVEVSTDVAVDLRQPDDLVAVRTRERSYTVVSAIPAVDEAMLRSLPAWGEGTPLPDGFAEHLALPETVTPRTEQLAARITAGQTTAFDKAAAIEGYLRQYTYDLEVPPPPSEVDDVADYFLFDLQRGYCDYYATAFVILARLSGLPARFATGFAVGRWDAREAVWIITEAEAHSWPEVYFPQVGWVPFEPTAGRPSLERIASPQFTAGNGAAVSPPPVPELPDQPAQWEWQTLLWLIPLALLVWGGTGLVMRWRRGREDPWEAMMKWGRHAGRPMDEGETVLEYGHGLADYVMVREQRAPDAGRIVAREVRALSGAVSTLRYGPEGLKLAATHRAAQHWQRLRHYLRDLRIR